MKRQVDLEKESLKSEIDKLADGLIQQLETYKARFKSEYKTKVDFDCYNNLVESSKKQLAEYETCLSLFSVEKEKRKEKCAETEKLIGTLKPKIEELKKSLFSNLSIKLKKMGNKIENVFSKLIIKVSFV